MDSNRLMQDLILAMIMISVPLIILLGSSLSVVYDKSLYLAELEKNNVYANFNSRDVPENAITELVSYFRDDSTRMPDISLFTPGEESHLKDVKSVIIGLRGTLLASLILLVGALTISYFLSREYFISSINRFLLFGGLSAMAITLLIVILALNFDWAFIQFHHLFFPQGNWMFAPSSNLIRLFPESTFSDLFAIIIERSLACGAALFISGLFLEKGYKSGEWMCG